MIFYYKNSQHNHNIKNPLELIVSIHNLKSLTFAFKYFQ